MLLNQVIEQLKDNQCFCHPVLLGVIMRPLREPLPAQIYLHKFREKALAGIADAASHGWRELRAETAF